jgi:hypothetical protein
MTALLVNFGVLWLSGYIVMFLLEYFLVDIRIDNAIITNDLVHLVTLLVLAGTVFAVVKSVVVLLDATLWALGYFSVGT